MYTHVYIYTYIHTYTQIYRYPIDTKRSIFMFREGSQVVDAKNFLLEQPKLYRVTLEGQTFYRNAKDQVLQTKNKYYLQ